MAGNDHLQQGQWQLGLAYRHLHADRWLVGREQRQDKAPFGQPLQINIQSVDLSLDYGLSERAKISLTVPFLRGTHERVYADGLRHEVRSAGLGDVNLTFSRWMFSGQSAKNGNMELGIGIKSPSGRNDVSDDWYLADGSKIRWPVDQGVQLGDGGWGLLLQGHGYHRLARDVYGYASAGYLVSPRNQSAVLQAPSGVFAKTHVSVPDVFLARIGAVVAVNSTTVAALGVRLDGIPIHDLIGGSDGFRRPAIVGYVEPSVSVTRGVSTYSVTVPVRAYYDFRRSLVDRQLGTAGGGDLARVLLFLRYQIRF